MTSVNQFWRRAKLPLAVSLASTLAGPAFGVSFNVGEIEGQFDSVPVDRCQLVYRECQQEPHRCQQRRQGSVPDLR